MSSIKQLFILILFIILVVYLFRDDDKEKRPSKDRIKSRGKRPAFSRKEWVEAKLDWFDASYEHDMIAYPKAPRWEPFDPGKYEEVMYDRSQLERLREMVEFTKKHTNELLQERENKNKTER